MAKELCTIPCHCGSKYANMVPSMVGPNYVWLSCPDCGDDRGIWDIREAKAFEKRPTVAEMEAEIMNQLNKRNDER